MIGVEVKKSAGESNANLLRRFSKRVQGAGLVKQARGLRFATRAQSPLKKKLSALHRLEKRVEMEHLKKTGKIK